MKRELALVLSLVVLGLVPALLFAQMCAPSSAFYSPPIVLSNGGSVEGTPYTPPTPVATDDYRVGLVLELYGDNNLDKVTWLDSSGNGNNAVAATEITAPDFSAGSAYFDGIDDYMTVDYTSAVATTNPPITVFLSYSEWDVDGVTNQCVIDHPTSFIQRCVIADYPSGLVDQYYFGVGDPLTLVIPPNLITADIECIAIQNLSVTATQSTLFYTDGLTDVSYPGSSLNIVRNNLDAKLFIGNARDLSVPASIGITAIRVYNSALTPAQVHQIRNFLKNRV